MRFGWVDNRRHILEFRDGINADQESFDKVALVNGLRFNIMSVMASMVRSFSKFLAQKSFLVSVCGNVIHEMS